MGLPPSTGATIWVAQVVPELTTPSASPEQRHCTGTLMPGLTGNRNSMHSAIGAGFAYRSGMAICLLQKEVVIEVVYLC